MSPVIKEWSDKHGNIFYFEHLRYILINNDIGPKPLLVIGCKPEHQGNVIKAQYTIGVEAGVSQEEADRLCYQWALYVGFRNNDPPKTIPFYSIATEKYPI